MSDASSRGVGFGVMVWGAGGMKTGIVVIGRNEGERLVACLRSLVTGQYPIVYVDSGSSDGSPQQAASLGIEVTALDMSIPFTAARAQLQTRLLF